VVGGSLDRTRAFARPDGRAVQDRYRRSEGEADQSRSSIDAAGKCCRFILRPRKDILICYRRTRAHRWACTQLFLGGRGAVGGSVKSIPRSNSRSSTFRRPGGKRTYISTINRICARGTAQAWNRQLCGFSQTHIARCVGHPRGVQINTTGRERPVRFWAAIRRKQTFIQLELDRGYAPHFQQHVVPVSDFPELPLVHVATSRPNGGRRCSTCHIRPTGGAIPSRSAPSTWQP
jgi:hypothetical protein